MRHALLRSCSELHFCFEDKGKVCHPGPIATSNLLPPPWYKSFREINKNTFPFQKPFVCEEIWILERLQSQVCTDQICTWEGKQGVTLGATSQHFNIHFPAFQHPNFFLQHINMLAGNPNSMEANDYISNLLWCVTVKNHFNLW